MKFIGFLPILSPGEGERMLGRGLFRLGIRGALRCLLLAAVLNACPAMAEESPPLEIGLVPNVTPRALFQAYQPMREFLEKRLQRPVQLYTAPDFKDFFVRTGKGEFDIVVTPAHFARAAQVDAGYVPMLQYKTDLKAIMVAPNEGVSQLEGLRGKRLAIVGEVAIVTLMAERTLMKRDLKLGADVAIQNHSAHNNAVLSMKRGEADAAVIGSGPYLLMPEETRAGIRVIADLGHCPNATFMAHPRQGKETIDTIRRALVEFADTVEGKAFMSRYDYQGFKPVSAKELAAMDEYSAAAKRIMGLR